MNQNQTKPRYNRLLESPAWKRSGDYLGRKGRDGRKKRTGKANEKREKVKRAKDEEVNGQGENTGRKRGTPAPRGVNNCTTSFHCRPSLIVCGCGTANREMELHQGWTKICKKTAHCPYLIY